MRNTQYYSQKKHSVIVKGPFGSRVLTDFDGDNAISWEYLNADKVQVTEGFDGSRLSFSSGKAGQIGVVLKPTSIDVGWLNSLINDQLNGLSALLEVQITTGVNETHRLVRCGIKKEGNETGGPTMTGRKYIFVGEELLEDTDF